MIKKIRAFALSLTFLLTVVIPIMAEAPLPPNTDGATQSVKAENNNEDSESGNPDYRTYRNNCSGLHYAAKNLLAEGQQNITAQPGMVLTYTVQAPEDGLYEFKLKYVSVEKDDLLLSLKLNGELPFEEAEYLEFPSFWKNSEVKRRDGRGNEISPEQVLYDGEIDAVARDYTGANAFPYLFALNKGENTISLSIKQGTVQFKSVFFSSPEQLSPYNASKKTGNNVETLVIEGENAVLKSGRSLIPLSDGSSPNVNPADPVIGRLNYIGGNNWKSSGDMLTWEFNVEQSGYYSLGFLYRQNIELGEVSYRHLFIDGKTPFEEASRIKFKYSASWKYYSFSNGTEPYYFYLDKGKHTLSLMVTPGDMEKPYAKLKEISSSLGDLYVDITMLVGETVDVYRSYELFRQIPDFNDRLKKNIDALQELAAEIKKLQEKSSGSMISTITHAVEILEKMLNNPYSAHKYKSAFYTAYTNLGAMMGTMTNMPLDIDRIFLVGSNAKQPDTGIPYFNKLAFKVRRFISTFQEDYNAVSSDSEDGDSLTLWVNWGRDQAQVLNALIDESFTPKHGISVKVEVVNATLIQGILAGKGPDCMLHMARTEPVNLAMRGALLDLQQFDDYDQVAKQFLPDAVNPYTYKNRVYALPDTQTFNMLFVRTDILKDMELSIPATWEEFAYVTTMLQRQNLQVYMPQSLYPTFLIQNNLPLYDEAEGITRLTGQEQIQCFINYTNWYTKYKIPKTMDSFFNRFRIGSVPMGIFDFTMLTQLETAAPEILGRWEVAKLPGTVNGDGTVSHYSSGSGTGCAITKLTKSPEKAWSFLKWWVSEETQYSYSSNLESILGPLGRVSTANLEAFSKLGWRREIQTQLMEQLEQVRNLPELPGGYYVYRSIDQAFWNVVEQNATPYDTMQKWGVVADNEMRRKSAEYANQ